MQRVIALTGGGSNGKGTFFKLIERLIGLRNFTASELKLLSERNFETAAIYKKLLCEIGEVGYGDLSNTSQIKKLSGEDTVRFEFKGKQPFSDKNTATILIATNSLPKTPDKSTAFYRRFLIIDFPNQFPLGRCPIDSITNKEMENLAFKCLKILKNMYATRKFSNEGTYEQREIKYEEKSNPLGTFINLFYDNSGGFHTLKKEFDNHVTQWLEQTNQRKLAPAEITKRLRDNGFEVANRKNQNGETERCVINLILKEQKNKEITQNTQNTHAKPSRSRADFLTIESVGKVGNVGNLGENTILTELLPKIEPKTLNKKALMNSPIDEKSVNEPFKSESFKKFCQKCQINLSIHHFEGKSLCDRCYREDYYL